MKGIGHVDIQKDLEAHGLLDLILHPWDVRLSLQYIGVQPPVISTEAYERLRCLRSNYQRRRPGRGRVAIHIACQSLELLLGVLI